MRIKVLVVEKDSQKVVSFTGSHFIVGRKNSNLNVDDRKCSGQHFVLYQGPGDRLWLKDLVSTNGTTVNGKAVKEIVISKRDYIRFGETQMIVLGFEPVVSEVLSTENENKKNVEAETEDETFVGTQPSISDTGKQHSVKVSNKTGDFLAGREMGPHASKNKKRA